MLRHFKALTLDEIAITGGSTKPCIITVEDEDGIIVGPYVVKLYPAGNNGLHRRTVVEFLCAILAGEFGLFVPEPAVIEISIELLGELWRHPAYHKKELEPGNYFGCTYLKGGLDFTTPPPPGKINLVDLESVFGFDVLIRNWDRRSNKPNCFFKDNSLYLIDHEYGLNVMQSFDWYVQNNGWHEVAYRGQGQHLMLPFLKQKKKKGQLNFHLFEEHLRHLDLAKLRHCLNELEDYGILVPDFKPVFDYLGRAKQIPNTFTRQLLNLI